MSLELFYDQFTTFSVKDNLDLLLIGKGKLFHHILGNIQPSGTLGINEELSNVPVFHPENNVRMCLNIVDSVHMRKPYKCSLVYTSVIWCNTWRVPN